MRRTLARTRVGALLGGLAVLASACSGGGGDGLQAVRDPERQVFFEVPGDWTVYEQSQLQTLVGTPFVVQDAGFTLPVLSRVIFQGTASPDATVLDGDVSVSNIPIGSAVVRSISASQRDDISRRLLADLVIDYRSQPVAQEVLKEDVEVAEDYSGVQLVVLYNDAVTEADAGVAFISITDPEVRTLYTIAVGCSLDCFGENQEVITGIIDSWLVNPR